LKNQPLLDLNILSGFVLIPVKQLLSVGFHFVEQILHIFELHMILDVTDLNKAFTALLAPVTVLIIVIPSLLFAVVLLVFRRFDQIYVLFFAKGHILLVVIDH
jgi:hypothetical protein